MEAIQSLVYIIWIVNYLAIFSVTLMSSYPRTLWISHKQFIQLRYVYVYVYVQYVCNVMLGKVMVWYGMYIYISLRIKTHQLPEFSDIHSHSQCLWHLFCHKSTLRPLMLRLLIKRSSNMARKKNPQQWHEHCKWNIAISYLYIPKNEKKKQNLEMKWDESFITKKPRPSGSSNSVCHSNT